MFVGFDLKINFFHKQKVLQTFVIQLIVYLTIAHAFNKKLFFILQHDRFVIRPFACCFYRFIKWSGGLLLLTITVSRNAVVRFTCKMDHYDGNILHGNAFENVKYT